MHTKCVHLSVCTLAWVSEVGVFWEEKLSAVRHLGKLDLCF